MPKISVVIPTYNRAGLLPTAVKSVLQQSFADWELVIIDDGSKDNTKEVVEGFNDSRIKYHYQQNAGVASAMNTGFRLAQGDFFAWLDSDNYYEPSAFKDVTEAITRNPHTGIFYGNLAVMDGNRLSKIYRPPRDISYEKVLLYTSGAVPAQPGVFFRNHLFKEAGGFDTSYRIAGDIDFWVKVLKLKPECIYIDKTLGYYLQDDKAISQGFKGIFSGYKEMRKIFSPPHGQPWYGKFLLFKKYATGYMRTIIRSLVKKRGTKA